MPDITSANTTLLIAASTLPVPVQIQGFSTDDIFRGEPVTPVETQMGLDGTLSGGYVPTEKKTDIILMAGSPSTIYFDAIQAAQDAGFIAILLQGTLTYPSIGRTFVLVNGFLTRYPPFADAKKTLMPRTFQITWQNIIGFPITIGGG